MFQQETAPTHLLPVPLLLQSIGSRRFHYCIVHSRVLAPRETLELLVFRKQHDQTEEKTFVLNGEFVPVDSDSNIFISNTKRGLNEKHGVDTSRLVVMAESGAALASIIAITAWRREALAPWANLSLVRCHPKE